MLISGTEPPQIKALGKVSAVPERYGCDILIVQGLARTGVQRKQFPADLLSSLADGRLYTQLPKMAELDRSLLILEGYGSWTLDGELVDYARFTKSQLYGLIYSLAFEFGVQILTVRDIKDTCAAVKSLEAWAMKPKHTSLRTRPGPQRDSWGGLGDREYASHFLQGLPGVGVELAGRIFDHFGKVPIKWDLEGVKDLLAVPGIGKVKAQKIWEVLSE